MNYHLKRNQPFSHYICLNYIDSSYLMIESECHRAKPKILLQGTTRDYQKFLEKHFVLHQINSLNHFLFIFIFPLIHILIHNFRNKGLYDLLPQCPNPKY